MPPGFLLSVVFFVSELSLLIFRRSGKSEPGAGRDKNSLLLFWIVIPCSIGAGMGTAACYPLWPVGAAATYIAPALVISGLLVRWLAIIQLGKAFTVNVAIAGDQQLKTDGLYGIVRHPSYTGLLMVITGLAFYTGYWLSFLCIFLPITLALAYRISIEEKALAANFGNSYEAYKKRTKRLVPLIY